MKFVFALALVAVCVMLMHARPNVKRAVDEVRVHKRATGGNLGGGENRDASSSSEEIREGEEEEEIGESKHTQKKRATGGNLGGGENRDSSSSSEEIREGEEEEEIGESKHTQKSPGNGQRKKRSILSRLEKRAAVSHYVQMWPTEEDGTVNIPYKFQVDSYEDPPNYGDKQKCSNGKCTALKDLVKEAADEWNYKAGLNIHLDQSATESVIVIKAPEDTPDDGGCWSWVGYQGVQHNQITLEYKGCFSIGVIIHEIGHALGLSHEAKRADANDYIQTIPANIKSLYIDQFTVDPNAMPVDSYMVHAGDYDYCSIMHYSAKAFSKDGKDTINLNNKDLKEIDEEDIRPCLGSQLAVSIRDGIGIAAYYHRLASESDAKKSKCENGGYLLKTDLNCRCSNLFMGKTCEKPISDASCGTSVFDLKSDKPQDIKTPNFGSNKDYPLDTTCVWAFHLPEDHELCLGFPNGYKVEDPSTSGSCAFDFFEVVFDPYLTLKTKRYCGTGTPWYTVFPVDEQFAALKFQSDDMYAEPGFTVTAVALPEGMTDSDCESHVKNGGTGGGSVLTNKNDHDYGYSYYYYFSDYFG